MGGGTLLFAGLGTLHDKRQRAQARDDYRHYEETVLKAQRAGLVLYGEVSHGHGLLRGCGAVKSLRNEHRREAIYKLPEIGVAHAGVRCEADLVRLVLPREEDTQSRSPDAAADVAHEAGDSRDLVILFARDADVIERADGNEDQRHEDHLEHA